MQLAGRKEARAWKGPGLADLDPGDHLGVNRQVRPNFVTISCGGSRRELPNPGHITIFNRLSYACPSRISLPLSLPFSRALKRRGPAGFTHSVGARSRSDLVSAAIEF
jgi:hypothetical protein